MNFWEAFLGFLFAFIVKDFYDIFIQNHIKRSLHKSKFLMKIAGRKFVEISENGKGEI